MRSGRSRRAAAAQLAAKGVDPRPRSRCCRRDEGGELAAALVLARRRRIGPFRPGQHRMKRPAARTRRAGPRRVPAASGAPRTCHRPRSGRGAGQPAPSLKPSGCVSALGCRLTDRTWGRFRSRLVGQHLDVAGDLASVLDLQAAAAGSAQHLAGGAHDQAPRAVSVPSIVPAISASSTSISPLKMPPGDMASSVAWIMVASTVPSTTRRSASCTVP